MAASPSDAVRPLRFALLALQAQVVGHPNVYGEILVSVLALYGLTAYATSRRAASLSALACLGFAILMGFANTDDPIGETLTLIIFGMVVMLAGWVVHRQRDRADEMQDQRDRAERRAAEIAASERARIARELHDVVAHGMSVVVLQARGGRRMVERDPVRAHRAFDDIEQVASQSLDEMRRLLGILRRPTRAGGRAGAPTETPRAPGLVEQARASGAAVDLVVAGSQRELAPAVELSAYRIAQEALTNSIKHAPGSTARIRVDYQADDLRSRSQTTGRGCREPRVGTG